MITVDNFLPAGLLRAVAATWPADDWPHWHLYAEHHKLASKDAHRLPDAARLALAKIAEHDVGDFAPEAFPDLDLHGAGMHSILPRGDLPLHLDGMRYPLKGWRREVNAVLFVDPWQRDWGGALEFWDGPASGARETVAPAFNRLVLFATGELAYHRVAQVTGPRARRTLSLFWWSESPCESSRDRASFLKEVQP